MRIDEIAQILKKQDNIFILTHQYPDGDTLGSACALCMALQSLGKDAKILNNDTVPAKYRYLFDGVQEQEFSPVYLVSVDVADCQLLGENLSMYGDKVDLCIDHHGSNVQYAKESFIDSDAAATAEIIYDLIRVLQIEIDQKIASCIYTGISTDTGCFNYANVTPKTHLIAADLLKTGIDAAKINRLMFDKKSRQRIELEKLVMGTMEFFFDSRCAFIYVTNEMCKQVGASEEDLDGLASIPRKVDGVIVGVTLREKQSGIFKISLRVDDTLDASAICAKFSGGGHRAAAGCTIGGGLTVAKQQILEAIKAEMDQTI